MVGEPDAIMQPTLQDSQLMSKHRVLSFKPQLRLERRGQGGQDETQKPYHSASLGDSVISSTRMEFSVHTDSWRYFSELAHRRPDETEQGRWPNLVLPKVAAQVPLNLPLRRSA